ncbi:hydrogenobyrinic acid a,c-diamide synthase (glutamine-hydrolysing) [Desulfobotulus alkaliphilus]|uniref:Cobyrinate a,c-diamide synthase n=1 Tax=Desulfobotulus alkaliphilus TaxID=622671 RepID=A0A562S313_9BACT|nr:cobyrinate a,c-diamide synthase [Desulfobotulus alkaliphilus]TWI75523.1 hydrogenobyrinic acid a,c-diamide synthase (glutamine-hydrolysing) [Desulfobotulus alkaliphilus]
MRYDIPRIAIAALRGGSGKTILSIGLAAAWTQTGIGVAPFKKGPDYIDAGWLAFATGRHCYNLDTYLCEPHVVRTSFFRHSQGSDIALIEGNRGLYDGIDLAGNTSTADIAKLIDAPVLLCLDVTKSTRTMAALVLGCLHFDPDVRICGVVLNRVAGTRHAGILTKAIEHHTGVPVLGAIPKLRDQDFPERHMGLVPTQEHGWATHSIRTSAAVVRENVDMDRVFSLAQPLSPQADQKKDPLISDSLSIKESSVKIGFLKDAAFQFYYPENLEALEAEGAELIPIHSLEDQELPEIDALYIGGGFPETHATSLTANASLRKSIFEAAHAGLPIYAECGGLMYLGEALILDGTSYPMCGVFPVRFGFSDKPQGHGYVRVTVEKKNPFFPEGLSILGHEFRYSRVEYLQEDVPMVFSMGRGTGITKGRDGLIFKNTLAAYTHIHALGTPQWAPAMVNRARMFKEYGK